jgi:acetylornithine deacetylase
LTSKSAKILADLVAFDTTSATSNLPLLDYVEQYLGQYGVSCRRIFDHDSRKANLWASIGPDVDGGLVLSGHTDCVPVEGQAWSTDPFTLTEREGKLYGRGSSDMKGFLASVLATVPYIASTRRRKPVHLAFSYDEEIGCTGVRSLLAELASSNRRPANCLVGEPTSMQVVTGHKGGCAYRCRVEGTEMHSSLAPLGVNAIEYAARLIVFISHLAESLEQGPQDKDFDVGHSTISTGLVEGGVAHNIVPKTCRFVFEIRNLFEVSQDEIFESIRDYAISKLGREMLAKHPDARITFERIFEYPAHAIAANDPFVSDVKSLLECSSHRKVAFGAEAGLFLRDLGVSTVICGPGTIDVAHKPDEYITRKDLDACDAFLKKLCTETVS